MSFAITISGCGSRIVKPDLEFCLNVIKDTIENSKCVCGMVKGEKFKKLDQVNYIHAVSSILDEPQWKPISYCHKATALRPSEWEKLQNYMHDLELENKSKGMND